MMPRGHYNATIRPGDNIDGGRWLVVLLVAVLLALFYML